MPRPFPKSQSGVTYLSEGGVETEIMYKHGFTFPHFAMFELLKNPDAVAQLHGMYRAYFDVVAKHGAAALVGGFDYRASPDWGALLGYSASGLRDVQSRCIEFLREAAKPYEGQISDIRIVSVLGPRGDAYSKNETLTAEAAEEYHSTQLETVRALDVDLVWAGTLSSVAEAVGVSRAASRAGVPVCVSFTIGDDHRLLSGHSLEEAITTVDVETGSHQPDFYGVNCDHPDEFGPALGTGAWMERLRCIRPNAAKMDKISLCKLGHLEDGNPVELGQQMGALAKRYPHMDIFGGCCGTWDRHIDEIAGQVLQRRGHAL